MTEIRLNRKPELLAPAGDIERLKFAYLYGADAAYVGIGDWSLRCHVGLSFDELQEAVNIANAFGKKLYVTLNIFAHDKDIAALTEAMPKIAEIKPHGVIISDPGVFSLAKELMPEIPIHISTQANNTNARTVQFWKEQGAERIVLARELSLDEIKPICDANIMETEMFVHGAICISYSGRCLLSNYMTGNSANLGDCNQPCRWKYALTEEKRPGQYYPIEEDRHGGYIMNSRDMCQLDHVPELIKSGVDSWKIEGRNKSAYYVASIVRIYRQAIDRYFEDPLQYETDSQWFSELAKVSNREYTDNFASGLPDETAYRYDSGNYERSYDFAGVLLRKEGERYIIQQRNHFKVNDELEVLLPDGRNIVLPIQQIFDEGNCPLDAARHPRQIVSVVSPVDLNISHPLICRRSV